MIKRFRIGVPALWQGILKLLAGAPLAKSNPPLIRESSFRAVCFPLGSRRIMIRDLKQALEQVDLL